MKMEDIKMKKSYFVLLSSLVISAYAQVNDTENTTRKDLLEKINNLQEKTNQTFYMVKGLNDKYDLNQKTLETIVTQLAQHNLNIKDDLIDKNSSMQKQSSDTNSEQNLFVAPTIPAPISTPEIPVLPQITPPAANTTNTETTEHKDNVTPSQSSITTPSAIPEVSTPSTPEIPIITTPTSMTESAFTGTSTIETPQPEISTNPITPTQPDTSYPMTASEPEITTITPDSQSEPEHQEAEAQQLDEDATEEEEVPVEQPDEHQPEEEHHEDIIQGSSIIQNSGI